MTVLVAYATEHGSTSGIADRISTRLRQRGIDARACAAADVLDVSGYVVTSAALITVALFSIFTTLPPIELKVMGVGMGAAILIDATVVRGILLPAALALLGDRAWTALHWLRRPAGSTRQLPQSPEAMSGPAPLGR